MEFCNICNNLLYLKESDESDLIKYCRHCKFEHKVEITNLFQVSKTNYTDDDLLYNQHINKFLRYDPTLRRISDNSIKCKNQNCSGKDKPPQVLYIKYNSKSMQFLYVCDYCGNNWRM
jgi:DNA-directed RNA polymerase subunit M/transcription elongation factor TFIIS